MHLVTSLNNMCALESRNIAISINQEILTRQEYQDEQLLMFLQGTPILRFIMQLSVSPHPLPPKIRLR